MRVRLKLNIGTNDNRQHHLGLTDLREGAVAEVEDDKGELMLKRGWAERAEGERTGPPPATSNITTPAVPVTPVGPGTTGPTEGPSPRGGRPAK
jgi:hypothetical protein